jgi:uncharacterized repeat protein (TIGR03803 family)
MAKIRPDGLLWFVCVLAALGIAPVQAQTASEIVLHNFGIPPLRGAQPQGGVIGDSAGNLYGTTSAGGQWRAGVVYIVDTAGHQTVLYSFTGGADGGTPYGDLVRDPAGNLYGTASRGGTGGGGVVYKLDTASRQTVLHSFAGGADGCAPQAGVFRDLAGNLYGTTFGCGTTDQGVVYKLDAAGHETVLHSFMGGTDGSQPYAPVIGDSAGNLYGTAYAGGTAGLGVVFKLDAAGQYAVLYSFTGTTGEYPNAGVIRDSAGNLYGTTLWGGPSGFGAVYKVDAAGQETILYSFPGENQGGFPRGGVIRDSAGNLYGTTFMGGTANQGYVYKLDTAGNYTVLHTFTGRPDGADPQSVIRDSAGNLYGTTYLGGTANLGAVFRLDAEGQETVLYSFPDAGDGSQPIAGLIRDSAGNFYGTTYAGGAGFTSFGNAADAGAVYKLDAAGRETLLYSFTDGTDGGSPNAGVIRDSAGNLYGTTHHGGAQSQQGVVYKLDTAGHETVLYTFTGAADGGRPYAGLVRDPAGNLYGTTVGGGTGWGVVYKVDTAGHEAVLYNFTNRADGSLPYGGVILDAAGNLYGTADGGGSAGWGVVYKVDTAGHETVLYNFTGGVDGSSPQAGLIRDSAGNFFGTTVVGGTANRGVVYKLDTVGHETVLYSFTGGADGGSPYAGVTLDSAGNLYGTTSSGGAAGAGVVYMLDTAGHETVLYNFAGGADGGSPYAGVIRNSAGDLYGTAKDGGKWSGGVVFKLTLQ